mmetsp:Transcript_107688/g.347589  ORF Transcript_107688/g.347589 Transcript_107688/m.347589 type:complete len:322 (+) Transcript_107688:585-1550(+)
MVSLFDHGHDLDLRTELCTRLPKDYHLSGSAFAQLVEHHLEHVARLVPVPLLVLSGSLPQSKDKRPRHAHELADVALALAQEGAHHVAGDAHYAALASQVRRQVGQGSAVDARGEGDQDLSRLPAVLPRPSQERAGLVHAFRVCRPLGVKEELHHDAAACTEQVAEEVARLQLVHRPMPDVQLCEAQTQTSTRPRDLHAGCDAALCRWLKGDHDAHLRGEARAPGAEDPEARAGPRARGLELLRGAVVGPAHADPARPTLSQHRGHEPFGAPLGFDGLARGVAGHELRAGVREEDQGARRLFDLGLLATPGLGPVSEDRHE